MSILHYPSTEPFLGPPVFSDTDLTRKLWEGVTDCPDCFGDLLDPDLHAADCVRVGTCGQVMPYVGPPLHPDPPDVYRRHEGETWREAVDRMKRYREEHLREFHAGEKGVFTNG